MYVCILRELEVCGYIQAHVCVFAIHSRLRKECLISESEKSLHPSYSLLVF